MDVVLCDEDKPFLSLLVWPNDKAGTDILTRTDAILRDFNHSRRGAASRIRRVALLEPPPDPVKSEISDKGTLVRRRPEEHTSELQSLMRISYAVFCMKKKT